MEVTKEDIFWMKKAFFYASFSIGFSDPNPSVGAVITSLDKKKLLSYGYTYPAGYSHAERNAIKSLNTQEEAILYSTLEPCNHYGRTPPCTKAILEHPSIKKVYTPFIDPHPSMQGKSLDLLEKKGREVIKLPKKTFSEEIFWTLGGYWTYNQKKRPRVFLKWAQTKEGFLAPLKGPSGKISSFSSLALLHAIRRTLRNILVTPGSVYWDFPKLTPRISSFPQDALKGSSFFIKILQERQKNPLPSLPFYPPYRRIYILPKKPFPLEKFFLFQKNLEGEAIFFTQEKEFYLYLKEKNALVFYLSSYRNWKEILSTLYQKGILNLLIEGGPTFLEEIFQEDWIDALLIFRTSKSWEEGSGFRGSFLRKEEEEIPSLFLYKKLSLGEDSLVIWIKNSFWKKFIQDH